jgi:hypothetical protein
MTPCEWLETVVGGDLAQAILDQRKLLKKPMGPLAAKGFAKQIAMIPEWQREQAIEFWAMKGWQGFEAEWILKSLPRAPLTGIAAAAMRMMKNGQEGNCGNSNDVERIQSIASH